MKDIQAVRYLYSFPNFEQLSGYSCGREFNLDRMRTLLGWFRNPQERFKSVLIAGTKGKGSTACFLESILRANGLRTGWYTSPHLNDFRERIRLGTRLISTQDISRLVRRIQSVIEAKPASARRFTFFEVSTLLAFLYFSERSVEWAVLEVGMGGRLDATNAVNQSLSVFTLIGKDHEEYLGGTVRRIAGEKAGIMKPRVPFVSAKQKGDVRKILLSQARTHHAQGLIGGRDFRFHLKQCSLNGSRFDFEMGGEKIRDAAIRLPGTFQVENASLAIAAVMTLERECRLPIHRALLKKGIDSAWWPGRFEVVKKKGRTFVLDGAHNEDSVALLGRNVRKLFPNRRVAAIFGVSREKKIGKIIPLLRKFSGMVFLTKADHPRAALPKHMVEVSKSVTPTLFAGDVNEACKQADRICSPGTVVVVTGSLFLVGEARRFLGLKKTH